MEKILIETALEGIFVDTSNAVYEYAQARKSYQEELSNQYQDIKYMLTSYQKNARQTKQKLKQKKPTTDTKVKKTVGFADSGSENSEATGDPIPVRDGGGNDNDGYDDTNVDAWGTDIGVAELSVNDKKLPPLTVSVTDEEDGDNVVDEKDVKSKNTVANKLSTTGHTAASGILAQLLLEIHEAQEESWKVLNEQATVLYQELMQERRSLMNEVNNSNYSELMQQVSTEIHTVSSDDPETELFVGDLTAKIQQYVCDHKNVLIQLSEQIADIHQQYNILASETSTGGWSEDDHQMFVKVCVCLAMSILLYTVLVLLQLI